MSPTIFAVRVRIARQMAGWKTRNNNSSTTGSERWRNTGPSAFQLQVSMLKSDKIWCAYLVVICASLRTFWTRLILVYKPSRVEADTHSRSWKPIKKLLTRIWAGNQNWWQTLTLDLCIDNAWVSTSLQQRLQQARIWQFVLYVKVVLSCQCFSAGSMAELHWYAATVAAVCVWSCCLPRMLPQTRSPGGLLMVHAMLILAVKVWLCGTTHV